ncbi:MAG: hypothetical protein U0003_04340 [Vampirovibrionales bacterium]
MSDALTLYTPSSRQELTDWLAQNHHPIRLTGCNPQPITPAQPFSLAHLNRVTNYWPADQTFCGQSGLTWKAFQETLIPHHHHMGLIYPEDWTLGDIWSSNWPSITTGLSGGYPADAVLGIEYLIHNGTACRAGGRVMKNVTGYDVGRFLSGSHNSLALVSEWTLKLTTQGNPPTGTWVSVQSLDELQSLTQTFLLYRQNNLHAWEWVCQPLTGVYQLFILAQPSFAFQSLPAHQHLLDSEKALNTAATLSATGWQKPNDTNHFVLAGMGSWPTTQWYGAGQQLQAQLRHGSQQGWVHTATLQGRPAAGLWLFSTTLTSNANPVCPRFKQWLESFCPQPSLHGLAPFAWRWTQWPTSLSSTIDPHHLPPTHHPERSWILRLKNQWDPHNRWRSPHLPLHQLV